MLTETDDIDQTERSIPDDVPEGGREDAFEHVYQFKSKWSTFLICRIFR